MATSQVPHASRWKWIRRVSVAWLMISLPCWMLCVALVDNWESSGANFVDCCGVYPCSIIVLSAMVFIAIPALTLAAIAAIVWSRVTSAP